MKRLSEYILWELSASKKQHSEFFFSGGLTVHCIGPTKMAHCDLCDNHDGTFILSVHPLEAGRHALNVKYGGQHVPGI